MKMENLYPKGSVWRKWDLHIHTPKSICQNYGGDQQWGKFIDALERLPPDVKVIGITDYYFIDGYEKVMQYKNSGRLKNIEKIFPILEFRIDTFGSGNENKLQKINLHILFDLDEKALEKEILKVKNEFILQIPITSIEKHKTKSLSIENLTLEGGNNLQKGFDNLIPSTEKVFELLNGSTWKNKVFLFLGYKEWSNLNKNNQLRPLKEDMYEKVSAFFTKNDETLNKSKAWLDEYGDKPLLHSGDIHDFTFLDTANKDESGEYELSKNYKCHTWIKADPTFEGLKQVIFETALRVCIQPTLPEDKPRYHVIDKILIRNENIFNNEIQINANLNSIIGGRSTGKSVLLTAIARKLKNSSGVNFDSDSFKNEYVDFVDTVAETINVLWKDGNEDNEREIEFFHQGYMYDLARNDKKRSVLIQDVLKQKGKDKVIDSFEESKFDNKKIISALINDYFSINQKIKEKKKNKIHKGDKKGIEDEITRFQSALDTLNTDKITTQEKENYDYHKIIIDESENKKVILSKEKGIIESLKLISLFKDDVYHKNNFVSPEINEKITQLFDKIKSEVKNKWSDGLNDCINDNNILTSQLNQLIAESANNQDYIKVSNAYKGSAQITKLEENINIEKKKLVEINLIIDELADLEKQKAEIRECIFDSHSLYYKKISEITPKLSETQDNLKIQAEVIFELNKHREILQSAINQQSATNRQLSFFTYDTHENYISHINKVFDQLDSEKLLLKSGYDYQSLASAILTECFYSLNYELEYEGDKFSQMSDGKKAFVILKLLLDFSNKRCPILIDQPEDDLDNRSIYVDLVQYLKKKKAIRQIIVATHNPNIAVGADSELIIVANQDGVKNENKGGKKFKYLTGSLEHTKDKDENVNYILFSQGIREHVCEILEGGDIAFKLREQKYAIKK